MSEWSTTGESDSHRYATDLLGRADMRERDDVVIDLRDESAAMLLPDRAVPGFEGPTVEAAGDAAALAAPSADVGVEVLPATAVGTEDEATIISQRWSLLAALVVLNILDLVTTQAVLGAGGTEANPLMAPIIDDPVAPVLVKVAGLSAVGLVLRACPPRRGIVDTALIVVTGLYGAVVSWNLLNLLMG